MIKYRAVTSSRSFIIFYIRSENWLRLKRNTVKHPEFLFKILLVSGSSCETEDSEQFVPEFHHLSSELINYKNSNFWYISFCKKTISPYLEISTSSSTVLYTIWFRPPIISERSDFDLSRVYNFTLFST